MLILGMVLMNNSNFFVRVFQKVKTTSQIIKKCNFVFLIFGKNLVFYYISYSISNQTWFRINNRYGRFEYNT